MGSRNNGSEYPEHLNPFNKRRNSSISSSFRGLKNTILKKFGKKRQDKESAQPSSSVLIRNHSTTADQSTVRRQTAPPTYSEPLALPRSRFSERVAKAHNPFDEVTEGTQTILPASISEETIEKPVETSTPVTTPTKVIVEDTSHGDIKKIAPGHATLERRRRRKKKRAPMPPSARGVEGDQYLDVPEKYNSKWSLVSVGTEYSSYSSYSEYGDEELPPENFTLEHTESLLNITREICKLADDTNNNLITEGSDIKTKDDSTVITETEHVEVALSEVTSASRAMNEQQDPEEHSIKDKLVENGAIPVEEKSTSSSFVEISKTDEQSDEKEANDAALLSENNKDFEANEVDTENEIIIKKDMSCDIEKSGLNDIEEADLHIVGCENIVVITNDIYIDKEPNILNDKLEIHTQQNVENLNLEPKEELKEEKEVSVEKVSKEEENKKDVICMLAKTESLEEVMEKSVHEDSEKGLEETKSNVRNQEEMINEKNLILSDKSAYETIITDNKTTYIDENDSEVTVEQRKHDNIDVVENRMSVKEKIEIFQQSQHIDDEAPVPKVRVKKLSRHSKDV